MKIKILSLASLMAITSLYAGTGADGVTTRLHHGHDVKTEKVATKSVETLSDMFTQGTTSGQIRMFYIDRTYNGYSTTHRNDLTLGGHLKFETASFNGVSFASSLYTTNSINMFAYDVQDPSLTANGEDYSVIGEAYVNVNLSSMGTKTNVKLGHQTYDTPMMGGDDARTLRNTFNVYKFVNKDIDGFTLQVAHVDAVAYGTFSNIYNGGIIGATSGYPGLTRPQSGKYLNMGLATVGKNTAGVTNTQINYVANTFHMIVSNDYAWDLYNTLYADAGVSLGNMFVQGQVIKQNSVGAKLMQNLSTSSDGEIDSLYYAGKVGVKVVGLTAYVAYSQIGENDATQKSANPYANAIVTQFGGMPAYTQGMVTRHQFLAGTKATKLGASYNFKSLGTNLSTALYYASFEMDANSGYGDARTATESGFDIKYYPASVKNLQLRFRGNFPREFSQDATKTPSVKGWDELRLLANYNF